MMIAVCPRCGEPVQVPAVSGGATVACPLCQSEYRLDEVLRKLPPTLRVVESPSNTETPTVVMETDSPSATDAATVVIEPTPAPGRGFAEEPPRVPLVEEPPTSAVLDADRDTVWGLHFASETPTQVENDGPEEPPSAIGDDTETLSESFDFDAGPTSASAPDDHAISSTVASRTTPRRRNSGVEFIKIALGGIAGLAIAQAILWWLPADWRKDPFGLAPRLPSQLAFLAPANLRKQDSVAGNQASELTTQGSADFRPGDIDLGGTFAANQADSQLASGTKTDRAAAVDRLNGGFETSGAAAPEIGSLDTSGEPASEISDESIDGFLGIRGAPSFTSLQITDSLVTVETDVENWVSTNVTDKEAARRLFKAFYELAWRATFADTAAKESVDLHGRIVEVLRMMTSDQQNVDLVGTAASSWLDAVDRPTQGILVSGRVASIEADDPYFATTLILSGKKEQAVTVVSSSDPSVNAQHGYQIGDEIMLLGSIVTDPPLDIFGYQGSGRATVIWGGPHMVLASTATDDEPFNDPAPQ